MSIFKIGDPISIPKGTLVFDYANFSPNGDLSKRASRGEVKQLLTIDWTYFIDDKLMRKWMDNGISFRWPVVEGFDSPHPLVVEEKKRIHDMLGGKFDFVVWGDRFALVSAVLPSVAAKPKEAKITKRAMMVKGSKWRFNSDVTVMGMAHPQRDHRLNNELKEWEMAGKPYDYDDPFRYCHELPVFTIKRGTEFTVTNNKLASVSRQKSGNVIRTDLKDDQVEYHILYPKGCGTNGLPMWQSWGENPWWVGEFGLPFNQVEDYIDAIDIPETLIYLLKDTETGEYFAGFHDDYSDIRNPKHSFRMSETVKSAKKFASAANAKTSIRCWTGQMKNTYSYPETFNPSKKADLPKTWVIVPVNKITLDEGEAIDIQEWYAEQGS